MHCLHLLGQFCVNKLHLLNVGGMIPIADVRLFLLLIHYLWKGDQDAMIRCMAEEWGRCIHSCWDRLQFWGPTHVCTCLKHPTSIACAARLLANLPSS